MNIPKKNSHNLFKTALVLIVVLALASGAYAYQKHKNDQATPAGTESGTVNLNSPGADEKADTKAHEDAARNHTSTPTSSSSSKQKVTPIITTSYKVDSDTFGVNGYVPDVIEDGSTCTLKLERSGKVVTKSKTAAANASSTTCGVIEVPYSSLSKGTWKATLSYSSSTAAGSSAPENIEVQ